MRNDPYSHVEQLDKRLYCLKEVESISRYLILGEKKALLFDTGYGYTDLTEQIKELTSLPLVVVNSHGDPDHALGSYQFPQVYLHYGDFDYLMNLDRDSQQKKGTIEYRLKKTSRACSGDECRRIRQASLASYGIPFPGRRHDV